jgi:hypothetical protein
MATARGLPLRVMFQDEARFGRMSLPYACWAPKPLRPKVGLALVREFVYVYAAVCPQDGAVTWARTEKMNTANMSHFLGKMAEQFPEDFVLLVVDGASSHKSKDLKIPENIELCTLPPYSPELNPTEHLWDEIREKWFANKVFESLDAVCAQLDQGVQDFAERPEAIAT